MSLLNLILENKLDINEAYFMHEIQNEISSILATKRKASKDEVFKEIKRTLRGINAKKFDLAWADLLHDKFVIDAGNKKFRWAA